MMMKSIKRLTTKHWHGVYIDRFAIARLVHMYALNDYK